MCAVCNCDLNCQSMNREALGDLKALPERRLAKFAVLRASTFNKDLSNEKTFSQIHLDEYYIPLTKNGSNMSIIGRSK
jgi:hypothetical protein